MIFQFSDWFPKPTIWAIIVKFEQIRKNWWRISCAEILEVGKHFFAASSIKKMSRFEEVSPEEIKGIAWKFTKAPFIWRKVVPSKRVTLLAESTLPSVYMRKKLTRAKSWLSNNNRARACSDRLSLTELTRLGEPKCLYGEKLARLGGWPYHRKRVTRLGG